MIPKYPDVVVQLTGEDGNAFSIMGTVSRELQKQAKVDQSVVDDYMEESMAGDYYSLLKTAMKWVTVLQNVKTLYTFDELIVEFGSDWFSSLNPHFTDSYILQHAYERYWGRTMPYSELMRVWEVGLSDDVWPRYLDLWWEKCGVLVA